MPNSNYETKIAMVMIITIKTMINNDVMYINYLFYPLFSLGLKDHVSEFKSINI